MPWRLCILILLAASSIGYGQSPAGAAFRGTLPQVLLIVAQRFHVSVVGELVRPVPADITVEMKSTMGASATIGAIVEKCPGYIWERKGNTFIVAAKSLWSNPSNPMNQVVRQYTVPNNLSDFTLNFPNAVGAAMEHRPGVGGMLNGLGLPADQSPSLTVESFHNVTARQILLRVADEVGNLYAVLIMENAHPAKEQLKNSDFQWEIAGGPGLAHFKIIGPP